LGTHTWAFEQLLLEQSAPLSHAFPTGEYSQNPPVHTPL